MQEIVHKLKSQRFWLSFLDKKIAIVNIRVDLWHQDPCYVLESVFVFVFLRYSGPYSESL